MSLKGNRAAERGKKVLFLFFFFFFPQSNHINTMCFPTRMEKDSVPTKHFHRVFGGALGP